MMRTVIAGVVAAALAATTAAGAAAVQPAAHDASYLGTEVPLASAPWIVSLTPIDEHLRPAKTISGHKLRCSAAVIGPRLVVTANHCVEGYDMSHQGIHVGTDDLRHTSGRVVPIARVWSLRVGSRTLLHPDGEDTALIETTEPLGVPALPVGTTRPAPGELVSSFGFGNQQRQLVGGNGPPLLQRFDSVVLPACPLVSGDTEAICTSAANGGGVRPGDSGGPLVAWHDGAPQLVGDTREIVASGRTSASVYADVVAQRSFLAAPSPRTRVPVVTRPIRITGDAKPGEKVGCDVGFSRQATSVEYQWNLGGHGKTAPYYDRHGERRLYYALQFGDSTKRTFTIPRGAGGKHLQCVATAHAGRWFTLSAVAVIPKLRR